MRAIYALQYRLGYDNLKKKRHLNMNNIGVQIDDTRNQNSNKKTSSKFNLIKEN